MPCGKDISTKVCENYCLEKAMGKKSKRAPRLEWTPEMQQIREDVERRWDLFTFSEQRWLKLIFDYVNRYNKTTARYLQILEEIAGNGGDPEALPPGAQSHMDAITAMPRSEPTESGSLNTPDGECDLCGQFSAVGTHESCRRAQAGYDGDFREYARAIVAQLPPWGFVNFSTDHENSQI